MKKDVTVEDVLKDCFGCSNPVLVKPVVETWIDGYDKKRYLTKSGQKAYSKLVNCLELLDELTDYKYTLGLLIEDLDDIVEGFEYGLSREE